MLMSMTRIRALLPVLGLLSLAASAHAHGFKAGALEIGHPWARETPVGATVGAGYLTVTNTGTDADRLIAVETSGAGKVEIHEATNENGVAKMRPVAAVDIPAGGQAKLAPGGFHLMLIGLKEGLAEGMRIPATLVFEKAGRVDVEFAVEGMAYGAPGEHKH